MLRRGPLAGNYASAVCLVVFALVPFLSLTAAVFPLTSVIARSLHLSQGVLVITIAMSTAAYAFGTVMAVQFATHLPPRRMLLVYVTTFAVSSLLTAWAPTGGVFIGGFVTEGLCTSLMLIAAVPPLVTGFGAEKMPTTGTIMNLCIFGAVAAGPTVGGIQAASGSWRPLFWGVAAVAVLAAVFAVLTYDDQPPADPGAPWDFVAIGLAGVGCALAFFGAGELEATKTVGIQALGPLLGGAAMVGALVTYEYRIPHPLMPVKKLATTFPVFGILVAACASAASFGLIELVLTALQKVTTPTDTALLFLPLLAGAVATAGIFGALFRTRYTPVLAVSGLVVLVGAAALSVPAVQHGGPVVALVSGLLGLGVGASVSPALFVAGFSLRSAEIQRVFALVELVRGVTAFLVAPILIFLAAVVSASSAAGLVVTLWICLGIAGAGVVGALGLLWAGGARLQAPDLPRWQETEPAWESPPPLARFRSRTVGTSEGAGAEPEHRRQAGPPVDAEVERGRRAS